MKLSITARLVAMFAAVTLLTFAGIGAALYAVLQHELIQHQDQELSTNLQNLQYSIERVDTSAQLSAARGKYLRK